MRAASLLIRSREGLVEPGPLPRSKAEAEGGCGVIGFACSIPIEGRHLLPALLQMKNRGNGKGGGVAAVGLSHEQMGVPQRILEEDYLMHVAYLDPSVREKVEATFLFPFLELHHVEQVPTVGDYRTIRGLDVKPPDVWRYFVRVKEGTFRDFRQRNGLEALSERQVEDEFVYQNSFRLNKAFYSSLGEKKAFVLSHGRNMFVLKLVGYGDHVINYYQLEGIRAHLWIGHHRYPTKGKVWHPGGAHPFVGMHEALVHNGDFANYYSICEYLRQRNIYPLFLTDTEVSVLLFDLLSRVYGYPPEYLIEALAPTTERDFEMLPEAKKRIYAAIQASHIHGSPDGPWFFIIGRNDAANRRFQLLGITDTSMLRPQVFALQETGVKIGLIASERQAIDAVLRSLEQADRRFCAYADRYWHARGGSYTDGGAFIFTVDDNGSMEKPLRCTNKFGDPVSTPSSKHHYKDEELSAVHIGSGNPRSLLDGAPAPKVFQAVVDRIEGWSFDDLWTFCREIQDYARHSGVAMLTAIQSLTLLLDRAYGTGVKKQSSVKRLLDASLTELFSTISPINAGESHSLRRIDWRTRSELRGPQGSEELLVIDLERFPSEGEESASLFVVDAYRKGWRRLILYNLRGQRFCGCGLGSHTEGVRIDVYGKPGDYLAAGVDGAEVHAHGPAQDQVANIMKSGKLVIYGEVGQTFMYGAKGGEVFVLGSAAGRPLINAVGRPRVVINGTCLDYLAESFMAGDPMNGGGFVILNGVGFGDEGQLTELASPYPGGNLFSYGSGGALYIRDPHREVGVDQLNGGRFAEMTSEDWRLILPYLMENQALFGISVEALLTVAGQQRAPEDVYRKVVPLNNAKPPQRP